MTLPERCKNVRAQIERRNNLRVAHKGAEAFRARASELVGVRVEVVSELERIVVLRRKGLTVVKPPALTLTLEVLRECESALQTNPTESGKDYGRLKRSIEKVRKEVASTAEKALEAVNRDLPSIEEGFLKQVELIPAYAGQVARIREQRDRLQRGTNLQSMSAAELEQFLDRRNALRVLADQLNPEEFPKEVLDFFKAARHGGAPLDKFTPTVREWLSQRDQLKNVRVSIQH
jgi:hypothetical protein